jgi:hypothetical protein
MIYHVRDLDTGAWEGQGYLTTEEAADYANTLIKSAVLRREKRHLAICGGNRMYVEYRTFGLEWYT